MCSSAMQGDLDTFMASLRGPSAPAGSGSSSSSGSAPLSGWASDFVAPELSDLAEGATAEEETEDPTAYCVFIISFWLNSDPIFESEFALGGQLNLKGFRQNGAGA